MVLHLGDCQNYGPFLGPYYNTGPNTGPNLGDPKRDHNFDNPPFGGLVTGEMGGCSATGLTGGFGQPQKGFNELKW